MTDIKYHPLVDADTDGKEKMPMFLAKDERSVAEHHKLYLAEIVPHHFRLCSSERMPGKVLTDIVIRCPYCGKPLRAISRQQDGTTHALYVCDRCSSSEGRSESLWPFIPDSGLGSRARKKRIQKGN